MTPRLTLELPGTSGHGDSGHGHTLHNDPSELPDPEAVKAYEAEHVRGLVQGMAEDGLADARAQDGLVDDYFVGMKDHLASAAANPPPWEPVNIPKQLVESWQGGAERYGKTGNPYVEAPANDRPDEALAPLARAVERERNGPMSGYAESLQIRLQAAQSLQAFADGKMSQVLLAVVEVRQRSTGELVSFEIVQGSGNSKFDAHVRTTGPKALGGLPPPPEAGSGIHPSGLRSLWAFEGRIKYKKSSKKVDWSKDWWHFVLQAPLMLGGGSFDETTGEVEVIDLADPQFTCTVHMLRVY